jgi:hypothetical protein
VNHTDLSRCVVDWLLKNGQWNRAVSIDIEGDLAMLDKPTKPLLSLSIARRTDGRIEIKNFVLNEETHADEVRTFSELGTEFQQIKPLMLIGFNIRRFDSLILGVKLHRLENMLKQRKYEPWYWALRDAFGGSYVLDMMDPIRFEVAKFDKSSPKFVQLETAIAHPGFRHLKFRNTKNIVSSRMKAHGLTKWDVIYDLWKNHPKLFKQYVEGDVHDTLLLCEEIFVPKAQP